MIRGKMSYNFQKVDIPCKICSRQYVDESQEQQSPEYRQNILKTGMEHLKKEPVDWSSLSCNEPLPFCPCCLDTIEKIFSSSNACNLLKEKIEDFGNKFMLESFRNRKVMKSQCKLMKVKEEPLTEEQLDSMPVTDYKANCNMCYEVYSVKQPGLKMESVEKKTNIWEIWNIFLSPAIKHNECNLDWDTLALCDYEPVCVKCSCKFERMLKWNQELRKATYDMQMFKKSFQKDSLRRRQTKNVKTASVTSFNKYKRFRNVDVITLDGPTDNAMDWSCVPEQPQRGHTDQSISTCNPSDSGFNNVLDNPSTIVIKNVYSLRGLTQ